ncbi:unnamed protein product [Schistosoma intercalatum]|nr:unnamed protein product [Schistosoma intercalatum]
MLSTSFVNILDFVNVVNSIEKKYDINHPKSLQIIKCYNNERTIYENMKTEVNQEICDELKQLNQRGICFAAKLRSLF